MSQSNLPGFWRKPSAIAGYAVAVLSIAAAAVAAQLATVFLHTEPFVSLFLCGIMFAAWFGGFGPGLFAVALALLVFHSYLQPPKNPFAIELPEITRVLLFLITALFVSFLTAGQRKATESARRSRDGLLAAIEEQKRAEAALLRSEMYLAEAQRLSHTGSFGWSVSTGEVLWSDETFRIFQYDRTKKPSLESIVQRTHPDDRLPVQEMIRRASRDGEGFEHEYRLLMPDGSVKHVSAVAHAVKEAAGSLEFVGAVTDVSTAKRAEEELNKAQKEFTHFARVTTLGELTASIAHEVNQPLAAIVTNGEVSLRLLANEEPDLPEIRETLGAMIADGRRASDIIARLRALSKKSETEKVALDINNVIEEVMPLVKGQVLSDGVSLRLELTPNLPAVLGDRVQLQQVIINLVVNGTEAMTSVTGRPREMAIRSQRNDTGEALVAVQDSGVGIDPETAEHLFNAFFSTKPGGMGMGLSICRSIIENHGGKLSASRNAGPGATFQFSLPVHQGAQA